jgi:ATP synthase protein I
MSDQTPEPEDLRDLGKRLDAMRRREAAKKPHAPPAPLAIAFRFSSELVVALLLGGGIGWGLDWFFGTRPILLIVFFVLGAAAGIRNVVRAAEEMNKEAEAAGNVAPAPDEDDEER